jgi:hypothetical protein
MISPLKIQLKSSQKPIITIVLGLCFFMLLLYAGVYLSAFLVNMDNLFLISLISVVGGIIYFLAARTIFRAIFQTESIEIDHEELQVTIQNGFRKTVHLFRIDEIKSFGYAGQIIYTQHPLELETFDVTGLGATEKQLQYIIDEGNLEIETEETILRFGKYVTEWDAEEAISQLQTHIGKVFENKHKVEDMEGTDLSGNEEQAGIA